MSATFKHVVGLATDGTNPIEYSKPSLPLMIRTIVNGKIMPAMVDTGSAISIIHINTLRTLAYPPRIKYYDNVHVTANNGEMKTIGTVRLRINIKRVSTFVTAKVAEALCTSMLLGNDWIKRNNINILGGQVVEASNQYYRESVRCIEHRDTRYPVHLIDRVQLKPLEEIVVRVRIPIETADSVIFRPHIPFIKERKVLLPNALLKIEHGIATLKIINMLEYPKTLPKDLFIGTIEQLLPNSICMAMVDVKHPETDHNTIDLDCRVCYEKHTTKTELFAHLKQAGHFAHRKQINGPVEQIPSSTLADIDYLVEHISNAKEKRQIVASLRQHGKLFDSTKPSVITTTVKHTTEVKNHRPIQQRPYRKNAESEENDEGEVSRSNRSTQTGNTLQYVGAVTTRSMQTNIRNNPMVVQGLSGASLITNQQESTHTAQHQSINKIVAFNTDQLRQYQQQDVAIQKIIQNVDKSSFRNKYCVFKGLLYRHIRRTSGLIAVLVLPKNKIHDVLLAYHNSTMNGVHFGTETIYYKIRDRYYWRNMYNDIKEHVRQCLNCTINKHFRWKSDGLSHPVSSSKRVCKLPFDLPKRSTTITNTHEYYKHLLDYLEVAKDIARQNIRAQQQQSKQRYDNHRQSPSYAIGDFVWIKRLGMANKFTPKYVGPYQIIQQINDVTYRVQNPSQLDEIISVHANRTRPFHDKTAK